MYYLWINFLLGRDSCHESVLLLELDQVALHGTQEEVAYELGDSQLVHDLKNVNFVVKIALSLGIDSLLPRSSTSLLAAETVAVTATAVHPVPKVVGVGSFVRVTKHTARRN